jgi:ABC-type Fe3+/spermidine/putrescine transport system ATPase subunit
VRLHGLGVTLDVPGAPAASVHALIRPERIRLVEPGTARDGLTVVAMTVRTFTHFGDSVLVTGAVGTQPLRVRVPDGRVRVPEGATITIAWHPDDVHVIPDS